MFGKTSLPKHSLTSILGSEGDQLVKEIGMSRKKICRLRDKRQPSKHLCRSHVSCQPSGFYCTAPIPTARPLMHLGGGQAETQVSGIQWGGNMKVTALEELK
jgi:hypothetical protein